MKFEVYVNLKQTHGTSGKPKEPSQLEKLWDEQTEVYLVQLGPQTELSDITITARNLKDNPRLHEELKGLTVGERLKVSIERIPHTALSAPTKEGEKP